MTATHTAPFGFPHAQIAFMRQVLGLGIRGLLAVALIIVAGMLALATAFAGIALALVAVLMRLFGNTEDRSTVRETADGTVTLEAHKTPRGWTVE